jgi:hypothetical protein
MVVAVVAAMCSSGILVNVGRLFGICLAVALKLQLCLFFRDVVFREVYFELWEGEYVVVDAESGYAWYVNCSIWLMSWRV